MLAVEETPQRLFVVTTGQQQEPEFAMRHGAGQFAVPPVFFVSAPPVSEFEAIAIRLQPNDMREHLGGFVELALAAEQLGMHPLTHRGIRACDLAPTLGEIKSAVLVRRPGDERSVRHVLDFVTRERIDPTHAEIWPCDVVGD